MKNNPGRFPLPYGEGDGGRGRGRFAPSPTGRMHLGNVCAALISWLSIKSKGGKWVLRIEDLDPQRARPEYAAQIEEDLLRLGLAWDEGGSADVAGLPSYVQSRRSEIYRDALLKLQSKGLLYRCRCSRADIMATQAPHQSDGRIVYSGRCRPACRPPFDDFDIDASGEGSIRVWVPDREIRFTDRWMGAQSVNLASHCGDFVVRRSDGAWAYQLAVVVDDALMGITEVVRGEDLLLSSAQQIYLYEELGFDPPEFAHFPLIRNEAGQRLSKRDHAESLESLFARHTPEEIIGLAAYRIGLLDHPTPSSPSALLERYLSKIPLHKRYVNPNS